MRVPSSVIIDNPALFGNSIITMISALLQELTCNTGHLSHTQRCTQHSLLQRSFEFIMQLLPLELMRLIVELCSDSPNSLAALARTHPSFQRQAEKALYDTISIFTSSDDSLKCMETLATNPEKAALVRSLIIEYARDMNIENRRVTTYLSKSLINMHSLSDFRVRSRPSNEAEMKGLGKILKSVCKILIFSKPNNDSAGDTVEVIFDCTLFTATTFSTFHKSLRVKPSCRYLEYIPLPLRDTS
jgi:hypothetical protein